MTMQSTDLPLVTLAGDEYFRDPHALYSQLRPISPVARAHADMMIRGTGFVVTRYHDVAALYSDTRMSSDAFRNVRTGPASLFLPPIVKLLGETMVMRDDPDHRRIRSVVQSEFGSSFSESMQLRVDDAVAETIDSLNRSGVVDVVEDFAVTVTLRVIAGMLGIDGQRREAFHRLVLDMHRLPDGKWGLVKRVRLTSRLVAFLREVVADARANPGHDLVDAVIEAADGEGGLSERETLAMIFLLFYAGHDTTSSLLSNSVYELMSNSEQMDVFRRADEPARGTAVNELLRYVSPVTCGSVRTASEDIEVSGVVVPAGSQVVGMLISANRDESVFTDAHRLDLTRRDNPHLAFGFGPHFCLGHRLARMEGVAALGALVDTFPDMRPADPSKSPSYRPDISMRAMRALPVRLV